MLVINVYFSRHHFPEEIYFISLYGCESLLMFGFTLT